MGVSKQIVGKRENGEEVSFYTLENASGQQAVVTDLGAIWIAMHTPDKNGKSGDVVLAYEGIEALERNEGHLGAVVGRNANRIGGGVFTLGGKTYSLQQNNGRNNLHSGPDYLERRMYRAEVGTKEDKTPFVTFSLNSPEGDQGYPGTMDIRVTYSLSDAGELAIAYELAAGNAGTLCNFTNHAYFNLAGHDAGSVLDQILWIDADAITEGGPDSIPHGTLLPVAGTPFDFRTPKAIGKDIGAENEELIYGKGYDHNFCLNRNGVSGLFHAAGVFDPHSGRTMDVYTDMPGIQFYTANYLEPADKGKGGVQYHPRDAFALETQYYPNAINVPGWDQPVIKAGETKRFVTVYKFGTKKEG